MNRLKRCVLAVMFAAFGAQAQTNFYWTNTANGVWSGANWTNSPGPAAALLSSGDASYILNFNPASGTPNATNDLSNSFVLNGLVFGKVVSLYGNSLMLTNNGTTLPGITYNVNGNTIINNALVLATNLTVGGTAVGSPSSVILQLKGAISGTGGITKNDGFALRLFVANSFSGGVTVNGGQLDANAANALGPGDLIFNNGASFKSAAFQVTNSVQVSGTVTATVGGSGSGFYGAGVLRGTGKLNWGGIATSGSSVGTNFLSSAFSGALTIDGNAATGYQYFQLYDSGVYNATNTSLTLGYATNNPIALTNRGATATLNLGALSGSTNSSISLGTNTLTVGYLNQTNTFAGVIQSARLAKVGPGTLIVSGANTYTGTTSVANGTLVVGGSITGAVNVTGGTLVANGIVSGAVTVASAGTLTGTGTVYGAVAISGTNLVTVNAGALPLNVGGTLNVTGSTLTVLDPGGLLASRNEAYTLATFTPAGLTSPFASTSLPTGWAIRYNNADGTITMVRSRPGTMIRFQ